MRSNQRRSRRPSAGLCDHRFPRSTVTHAKCEDGTGRESCSAAAPLAGAETHVPRFGCLSVWCCRNSLLLMSVARLAGGRNPAWR